MNKCNSCLEYHDPCNPCKPCKKKECCEPDYDNCGCLNPTTFDCTDYLGATLSNINVQKGIKGNQVLSEIDTVVGEILLDSGKVLADGTDTCPGNLASKIEAGMNINLSVTGTGCDRKLVINSTTGGVPVDVNAKVTSNDTTSNYLDNKLVGGTYINKTILNSGSNESLKFDIEPSNLISSDSGNQMTIGTDGGLKTAYSAPDGSETHISNGTGVNVTGSGRLSDPYVISTNASIQIARPCFDGIWKNLTLVNPGNVNVVPVGGTPQFRYRFDGSLEMRGSLTFNIAFGNYSSGNRKYTVTVGNIPTTCLTVSELSGTQDLKSINYIDVPQGSTDQITQMYGYVIRKATQNIIIEFQSSFSNDTSKTVVINFDGVISHPNL